MTREEEITRASKERYSDKFDEEGIIKQIAFEEGANWADRNPQKGLVSIEKALKCFQEYYTYHYKVPLYDEYLLRKAMEKS